jgi:hypothetical protein
MKLLLLAATLASSQETAQFLKIQPAPRPMAMAEAYTAVADDLWSLNSNPAGLAKLTGSNAGFVHADLFENTKYDYLAFGRASKQGTFGVSAARVSHGSLEGRDANGAATGGFSAHDTAVSLAFARALGGRMSAGATVKYLESSLGERSGRSAAVDLGLQRGLTAGAIPLSLGVAVLNLGRAPRLGDTQEDLPVSYSAGAAARFGGFAIFSFDVRHRPHSAKNKTSFALGTEYAMLSSVALRAGYAPLTDTSAAAGPLKGLGMGLGLKLGRIGLDYSFTPAGELGSAQRLAFSTRW